MRCWILAALAAAALTGCRFREGDFTIIANSQIHLDRVEAARDQQHAAKTSGNAKRHWLFFFPITGPATVDEALAHALESTGGDCMVDAELKSWWWWIPLVYGQDGYTIEGRPIDTTRVQAPAVR